jgi:thiol-disulfide isomerase/thioredoxin
MKAEEMKAGSYVDYADFDADRSAYADGKVVLFFHAGWCPTCKQAEKSLTSDADIPAGLTIVKVDYDSATDLRRQYGVTQQHTFVSIGPDGSKQKAFTGAVTAADIAEQA